jgi:hypothetical protein
MKKILTLAATLGLSASVVWGQGTVIFNNTSATYAVSTNTATSIFAGGNQQGGTSGKTGTAANGFYYTLLVQSYTGSLSASATNITGYGWSQATINGTSTGIGGTNQTIPTFAGGINGNGGSGGVAVSGWALPTGSTYDTAGRDYYLIVGWSANLGSTWGAVQSQLASGWTSTGFFGVSALGNAYAGGANSLNAVNLFGVTAGAPGGLTSGFTLFSVAPSVVPEPGTMALAALGGASLLLFRRRKA